jgi:hypothetical protein
VIPASSTVGRVVAAVAAQRAPSDELVGCWVSPGWSRELLVAADRDWPGRDGGFAGTVGIAAALVARRHRHDKVSVCGYLVDVHCLGVKNALGPKVMDPTDLTPFTRSYLDPFGGEAVAAPLELLQQLVLGAVEYAGRLGFEPHKDFAAAAGHLGAWSGPNAITFGRNGKPFHVQGPYDDSAAIIQTLNRTVGKNQYHPLVLAT